MGEHKIPRIIHVIWAGGASLMPKSSIKNVISWMLKNPKFKIVLWVDEKTSGKSLGELEQEYNKLFESTYRGQKSGSVEESIPDLNFEVRNIRSDERICRQDDPLIDYEINRPDPNYGASSDMLRYRILYHYGGVYVDHDVAPKNSLNDHVIEFEENDTHVLYVDHLSQFADDKITEEHLKSFAKDWRRIANDIFICTANNPLMLKFIDAVENSNYQLRATNNIKEACKLAYRSQEVKFNTIERTGPDVIRRTIQDNDIGSFKVSEKVHEKCVRSVKQGQGIVDVEIKPIKSREYRLAQPCISLKSGTDFKSVNAGNWLNIPLDFFSYGSQETIVKSLSNVVIFEQEHFGILRLDDHLTIIEKLAKKAHLDEGGLIELFISNIGKIVDAEKLMVVQWTGLYKQTFAFYKESQLISKVPFLKESNQIINPEIILNWASSKDFFSIGIYNDSFMMKTKWFEIFKDSHKSEEIKRVFDRIVVGVSIINLMVERDNSLASEELDNLVIKYQDVLQKAKQAFIDEDISEESIDLLLKKINNLHDKLENFQVNIVLSLFGAGLSEVGEEQLEEKQLKEEESTKKRKRAKNEVIGNDDGVECVDNKPLKIGRMWSPEQGDGADREVQRAKKLLHGLDIEYEQRGVPDQQSMRISYYYLARDVSEKDREAMLNERVKQDLESIFGAIEQVKEELIKKDAGPKNI